MNVGFIGLGKLGLPCALAVESRGHKVVGYDPSEQVKDIIDTKKLQYQEIWAQDHLDKSKIEIKSIKEVVQESDIIFVPIQTPHGDEFEGITRIPKDRKDFDYTYLKQGIKDLEIEIWDEQCKKVVIIISTVLPGTIRREIKPILGKINIVKAMAEGKNDYSVDFINDVEKYVRKNYRITKKQMGGLNKVYKRLTEDLFKNDNKGEK